MPPVPADLIAVFVGRDLIGDGVMKLPFARVLRQSYPHARIIWLAREKSVFASPLRPLTETLIDEVIENFRIGIGPGARHGRPLLPRPDLLIDTQRHVPTSLMLRFLRPRHFVSASLGWRISSLRPSDLRKPKAMLGQMLRLLEACGCVADLARLPPLRLPPAIEAAARGRLPATGELLVGLAPGAGGREKCWPLPRFLTLARVLVARGLRPVVLLGPAEQEWIPLVREAVPEAPLPLAADDSPLLTIAIARLLAVAVANDSGTGHLLAAGGTRLISLFGPTDPEKFAPASPTPVLIRAQDFGAGTMAAIPEQAVLERIAALMPRVPCPERSWS